MSHLPLLVLWLLFIPNAPYILTDLFHLRQRAYFPLWYDLILVLSFAFIGMIIFLKSLRGMLGILKMYVSPFYAAIITPLLFWLISFGLYLGRYLRFNSWNIVNHPFQLFKQSFSTLFDIDAIAFTGVFSLFMWLIYHVTLNIQQHEKV